MSENNDQPPVNDTENASANSTTQAVPSMLLLFVTKLLEGNPQQAVQEYPQVITILLAFAILPSLLAKMIDYFMAAKVETAYSLPSNLEDPFSDKSKRKLAEEFAKSEAKSTNDFWQIGVGEKSVSIAEMTGALRAFVFSEASKDGIISNKSTIPTVDDIIGALLRAISDPMDNLDRGKPSKAAFLASRMCSDDTLKEVTQKMEAEYGLKICLESEIESELSQHRKTKAAESKAKKQSNSEKPKYISTPARMCHKCRKKIDEKPLKCSACKAVYYCNSDCQKKDWPRHKQQCPVFKKVMESEDNQNLSEFPFPYYTKAQPLYDYNQVVCLAHNNLHNVGLYRRLCGCFAKVPFGCLTLEMATQVHAAGKDYEKHEECLGIPSGYFPLEKKLKGDADSRSIKDWKTYFERTGMDLSNPIALVLESPLTVFHLLNEHLFPKKELPEKFVLHLVGVEREADLIPLFTTLLPLLPGVELYIHMIGPAIPVQIEAEKRRFTFEDETTGAKIVLTLVSGLYHPSFLKGEGFDVSNVTESKPDAVVALNSAIMNSKTWVPFLKLMADSKTPTMITEAHEFAVEAARQNLESVGAKVTETYYNPFKQPVKIFSHDNDMPAWSNGFYFGFNV